MLSKAFCSLCLVACGNSNYQLSAMRTPLLCFSTALIMLLSENILSAYFPKEGGLRLVGGRAANEGNIEIYHMNRWGSICDDEWDLNDGIVACRSLNYQSIHKITENSKYGKSRSK